jgi:glucose/arabinose dehydrogenase
MSTAKTLWIVLIVALSGLTFAADPARSQVDDAFARVTGHLLKPRQLEFAETRLADLRLPPGFQVNVFARDLGQPRMMAVGPDGTVYVTRRDPGDVIGLRDRDGDGRAEERVTLITGRQGAHGITISSGRLYFATVKEVFVADLGPDGSVGPPRMLLGDLPDGGQHPNRTIAVGPDGHVYVSIGSSCNACEETNPEHATIVRLRSDGSARAVFSRGLRNTVGWSWHPVTRDMWGMDHGSDWRGDDLPPEELNRLVAGAHYGWPFCHGNRQPDTLTSADPKPRGTSKAEFCAGTEPPTLMYTAHSAPIGFVFYAGAQFPPEYRGDAFVAMRGSWNRNPATGYKVVRIRFVAGRPIGFEDFLSGFLVEDGRAHWGRLAGLAVAVDGSLLVSDDTNGVIFRVSYQKP